MKDHIKDLCVLKGMKPVYTSNKLTMLSCGSESGNPTLRIHKIFKNCPAKTAEAVVDYYLDSKKRENNAKQIQNYARKWLGPGSYKIAPLNDSFIAALISRGDGNGNIDLGSVLMEHSAGSIEVQDGSIFELDIVLDI